MWGDLLSGTKRTGSGLLSQADGAGGSRDGARLRCPVANDTASGGSNSHQCLEPTRQPGGGAHGAARAGSCDPSLVRGIRHPSGQALSAATLVGTVPGVGGQSAVATSSLGQQFGPGPILEPALGDSAGEREPTRRRSGNRESSPPVECVVIEMPVRAADAYVHSRIGGRCLKRPRLRETTPQGGERRGGWGMGRAVAASRRRRASATGQNAGSVRRRTARPQRVNDCTQAGGIAASRGADDIPGFPGDLGPLGPKLGRNLQTAAGACSSE